VSRLLTKEDLIYVGTRHPKVPAVAIIEYMPAQSQEFLNAVFAKPADCKPVGYSFSLWILKVNIL
jgi:hypothetical protein